MNAENNNEFLRVAQICLATRMVTGKPLTRTAARPHRTPARTTSSRSGSIRIDDSRGGRRGPGTRRATRIGANTADLRGIDAARSARLSIAE